MVQFLPNVVVFFYYLQFSFKRSVSLKFKFKKEETTSNIIICSQPMAIQRKQVYQYFKGSFFLAFSMQF